MLLTVPFCQAALLILTSLIAPDNADTGPRFKTIIACHNGKLDSGSKCSINCWQPDGKLSPKGNMICGHPGAVSQVEWKFVRRKGDKDVYKFTRKFPISAENPTTTSKEVEFEGKQIKVFEDEFQCIVISGPKE